MSRKQQLPDAPLPLFSYLHGGEHLAGKMIVDLFAGGGGVSLGIETALGRSPDVAINHDEEAIAMHQVNHPYTRHYRSDVFEVDPIEATGGKPVALLWLSPDCKHHSRAKGGKPLDQKIRSLAWVGLKWAGKVRPDVIVLENVPDFRHWGRLVAQREALKGPDGKVLWPNKPKCKGHACRRWQRGMPKQHPPRGAIKLAEDGLTCLVADKRPRYRGRTFRTFVRELRALGYDVDFRTLVASDHGAPTIRERFFLIARCDGKAISWPEPTHGPGLLPVRTAAECIDWSIPTRTIFQPHARRKNDLEPNTLRRIAKGIDKFVLGASRPFLVQCNHGGHDFRQRSVDAPLVTITSSRDANAVVTPYFAPMSFGNDPAAVDAPAQVITTQGNKHTLIAPHLTKFQEHSPGQAADVPLDTVLSGATRFGLVAPHITKFREGSIGSGADAPLHTATAGGTPARPGTGNVHGLVGACLVKHNGGYCAPENASHSLEEPAPTVMAQGGPQALVSASLIGVGGRAGQSRPRTAAEAMHTITAKADTALAAAYLTQYNGTATVQPMDAATPTVSTVERFGLTTAHLTTYYGDKNACGDARGQELEAALATQTTENRHGLVTAHLLRQYGSNDAREVGDALGSITTCVKDGLITTHLHGSLDARTLAGARRVFAFLLAYCPEALDKVSAEDRAQQLVTLEVNGEKFVIYDIGMRMLEPRELYRCQSFPDSYVIDFSVKGRPLSKAAQVRMCGNSVPPALVKAIISELFSQAQQQAAD
ncbi:DNA cytosine methyltransferase [Deinococcus peraridilitoris]|uniref:DNA (cytosine-5-)-methyltransferase n=1 Tax=Deinococcus peraridilitoris (strain DSM 19664 / LMG 22246 / CIP 109416 / KR-200) TaxID=937777 RepID=L0A0Z3_DEIPD|nr:DNA cytosine methyltransferase [Deinococcus peraridilitoris]AFZ67109.1 site-specific DNA methylase [Deinococcus peraridilitoris DSM 19664]